MRTNCNSMKYFLVQKLYKQQQKQVRKIQACDIGTEYVKGKKNIWPMLCPKYPRFPHFALSEISAD